MNSAGRIGIGFIVFLIFSAVLPVEAGAASTALLSGFESRLDLVGSRLPDISVCAEVCAARTVANPELLIDVPYAPQPGFAEEMVNRSGGLANALPSEESMALSSPHDLLMFSVRSWAQDGEKAMKLLTQRRERGQLILLFASRAGAPEEVPADYWFDNGARDGSADHAGLNAVVNAVNGMLWCIEYVAAMSRSGYYPGILQGILEEGGNAHNAGLGDRSGRRRLYETEDKIPSGTLAEQYLDVIRRLVTHLKSEAVQAQIDTTAALIAGHIDEGGTVGLTTCTHLLMSEISLNTLAPWKPFNCVWRTGKGAFEANVGKGDLVVFFGYIGVSTILEDYAAAMRRSGADMIVSCAQDAVQPDNMVPEAVGRIDQQWSLPDAVIPLPFPPGHMGPVSGVESGLIFRMLDEAVAARLTR